MCPNLIFIFLLPNVIFGYDISPHEIANPIEKFNFTNDYQFVFFSKAATWKEAYIICQATHARLAVINTPDRADFIAQALSQTIIGFEDVWIGGNFANDVWTWIPTGEQLVAPENNFPPWIHYPTERGKKCLAMDRKNHWKPLFLALSCDLHRPFVCEQSLTSFRPAISSTPNSLQIGSSQYLLYHARVTWDEATAFCKEIKGRLAVVRNLNATQVLVTFMQRSRPVYESAWIGARREEDGWFWVSTGDKLEEEADLTGYPPWKYSAPLNRKTDDCLILDHHLCNRPFHLTGKLSHFCEEGVFLEVPCSLKRNVVCEMVAEAIVDNGEQPNTIDGYYYVIYLTKKTWAEAKDICERSKWTLAILETKFDWEKLLDVMEDSTVEIDHLWLGGFWRQKWLWLNGQSIKLPTKNSTWPPWCLAWPIHEENENCLNLDRDAHDEPLVYGFDCTIRQPFVCQVNALTYIDAPDSTLIRSIVVGDNEITHYEAEAACKMNTSELIVVNNLKTATDLAVSLQEGELFWIGARKEKDTGTWRWLSTNKIISNVRGSDGYPPWNDLQPLSLTNSCLALRLHFQARPQFIELECEDRHKYLCKKVVNVPLHPNTTELFHNKTYYFYRQNVTYPEAMAVCAAKGLQLVDVLNLEMANSLVGVMKDPLWTNGKQILDNTWIWTTTGQTIQRQAHNGYPPWSEAPISNSTGNCLLLTREPLTFLGENCDHRHYFVCMDKRDNPESVTFNNMTIVSIIPKFEMAKNACRALNQTIVSPSKIPANMKRFMKNENIKTMWLSVVRNESSEKWMDLETNELLKSDLPILEVEVNSDAPKNCLSLDLINDTLYLVPGFCNDFKHMICYKENPAPPEESLTINDTVTLHTILNENGFGKNKLQCQDFGGEVIGQDFLQEAIEFFKTLHADYKSFWIGATSDKEVWKWPDGSLVKSADLVLPTVEDSRQVPKCLVYSREDDREELLSANCNEKHSAMCQLVRRPCGPLANGSLLFWTPEECTRGKMEEGTICNAQCERKFLYGPDRFVCTKGNWTYKGITINRPVCDDDHPHAINMGESIQLIVREFHKSYLMFVIDNGGRKDLYQSSIALAKSLGNVVLLSNLNKAFIFMYSSRARIIDLSEDNNCYLYATFTCLQHMATPSNIANYTAAYSFIKKYAEHKKLPWQKMLLVFFALREDKGPMTRNELVSLFKNNGVTIMVVSIENDVDRHVCQDMASVYDKNVLYYPFKDTANVRNAARTVSVNYHAIPLQDCVSRTNSPCRRY